MTKEKQIEEMAKDIYMNTSLSVLEISEEIAEHLTAKGYRKASEIFAEIRTQMREKVAINEGMAKTFPYDADFYKGRADAYIDAINALAELKKKYTEEEK